MAVNDAFDWRRSDRRLFGVAAILFAAIVIIGFARTYYLRFAFEVPAIPSTLVHIHGVIMSAWVAFFLTQVFLVRTRRTKVHMSLGLLGIALAIIVVVVGFFTAAGAAKHGSTSAPPDIPPLAFFAVPFFDMVMFPLLFGAAIYYRTNLANHKRLMILTAIAFLPPAVARIPIPALQSLGPLFFFGFPALLTVVLVAYDSWRMGKVNKVFLAAAVVLIASYPVRLMISGTEAWMSFAAWVTSWAA